MKRLLILTMLCLMTAVSWGQSVSALDQLKANPRKAYGNDYPYTQEDVQLTKAPRGYKAFYISHYARHGSRYFWSDHLYKDLDTLLTAAHQNHQLTDRGDTFYHQFMDIRDELMTGVTELTEVGWQQHQGIARTMFNRFPEVFKQGGDVLAISSLVGRCVISMSAFCQELVQCNPKLEIREQSSRFTLDGVVPTDRQNPARREFPRVHPRYEQHRDQFKHESTLRQDITARVFTSTEGLKGNARRIGGELLDLYTSLPSIGHEGLMDGIVSDEEIAADWEASNLGSYSWVFGPQYEMIPILEDIIAKADAVISGSVKRVADLRFGHDTCIGPLTVLMGINGADRDPEDPYEVKNCYQNWETCKASNIQLVFYRGKGGADDILVKCLLNGCEASLPVPTTTYPYYRWTDFRNFYQQRCASVK